MIEVAEKYGVSKTTVHDTLFQDSNMSRVSARWVSRLSTSENLEKRVELPRQFIEKFDKGGATFLDRIITTDGRWLR